MTELPPYFGQIPMPIYYIRKACVKCGARFWTEDGYRGHYAYKHLILAGGGSHK